MTESAIAQQAITEALATETELREIAEGWRRWATHPDAWYAPEVEHAAAGCEARREVSGRVVDGTPLVRPQDALVVTVSVGHGFPSSARR